MREMVINYVPGESCRVALVDNGCLEELEAERVASAGHVGNIYIGRVTNVEAGIQAAFVDFGLEANGFLHVSDLHPRYFPGEDGETTERVGKKTPRRERPPIQDCLRKGQEVAVQVLKEGVGTKGPTVTSYLSIPGRFLVMMPQMDRVGVSRKVEDDDIRKKMRKILDELELPEGFGFILRTAGLEQTKRELKRDLSYLQRLWKDMERRWKTGSKPRLLYSESDLLVRALRDMLTSDIERIVIDDEGALRRSARFLKIVAPRSGAKLSHFTGKSPIFHAMGLEDQLQMMHAREVPLPSGGRLVIDETEALVAIDVNSGRMRDAKDAETTAYRTNMEAADEICRQLRLRDLGGLVIHDLIDMRHLRHRKQVEARFKENLKRDRARSTILPISNFGILEMTRQRMRGSHESVHFAGCPTCRGRGLLQRPDSVVIDAIRDLAALLNHDRVAKAEMVVSPRIAGELLSARRRSLTRVERRFAKHVDVRVSDAVPADRVIFHAYDDRGADIDVGKLKPIKAGAKDFATYAEALGVDETWADEIEADELDLELEEEAVVDPLDIPMPGDGTEEPSGSGTKKKRKRRRRRRGGGGSGEDNAETTETTKAGETADASQDASDEQESGDDEGSGTKKKRKRRRRKRSGRGEATDAPQADAETADEAPSTEASDETNADAEDGEAPAPKRKRSRRRSKKKTGEASDEPSSENSEAPADNDSEGNAPASDDGDAEGGGKKKRRRRRRSKKSAGDAEGTESGDQAEPAPDADTPMPEVTTKKKTKRSRRSKKSADAEAPPAETNGAADATAEAKKPRTLYGSGRRKLSASEIANLVQD